VATARQFCTFFLGHLFFGVEVNRVQEVIRYQPITPVPLAPAAVHGLINLRGQIVTAIDLRRLLELEALADDHTPMNIVVHAQQDTFSLLVDRIGDVLTVTEDNFERSPDTLTGIGRELIQGAYKLPESLLLVLDVDKAVVLKTG
jgi:purine-binding chemotaxis protein CheW